jgi:NADH-quinone oxidoreductase subunit C
MRKYTPKNDVQKKSYYNDRFYITPELQKTDVSEDEVFSSDLENLAKAVEIKDAYIQTNHLVIYIDAKDNFKAIKHLKNELEYDFLIELSAIDYLADRGGFEVFYEMLSTSKHKRLRLKCFIKEDENIESVNPLFRMADFSEREMFDMYGIRANNHPYMKRILMPDDWQDYPLRKSYPMIGDEAAQWYEVDKIFGKDYRDVIGPEIRDQAAIDRYDTERFARLGHEVPFGTDITPQTGIAEPDTPIQYQEDGEYEGGAEKPFAIEKFDPKVNYTLGKRK